MILFRQLFYRNIKSEMLEFKYEGYLVNIRNEKEKSALEISNKIKQIYD